MDGIPASRAGDFEFRSIENISGGQRRCKCLSRAQASVGQHADNEIICGMCAAKFMSLVSKAFDFLESPPEECLK
jgi:hypothetical protein